MGNVIEHTAESTRPSLTIAVNVTNDKLLLALGKWEAIVLHRALDEHATRLCDRREAARADLAAEPFHAQDSVGLIEGYTDELDTLRGLLCDVCGFAGRPEPPTFEGQGGHNEIDAAFLAFAEAREPR